jgi:hypothetical protein
VRAELDDTEPRAVKAWYEMVSQLDMAISTGRFVRNSIIRAWKES